MINDLKNDGVDGKYGRIWLDFEYNPSGGCCWTQGSIDSNCDFIIDLVTAAQAKGKKLGYIQIIMNGAPRYFLVMLGHVHNQLNNMVFHYGTLIMMERKISMIMKLLVDGPSQIGSNIMMMAIYVELVLIKIGIHS